MHKLVAYAFPILIVSSASLDEAIAYQPQTASLEIRQTIDRFVRLDPQLERLLESVHGFAVFPSVTQGALGLGVAWGKGEVFEKGVYIGDARITQITVGISIGGQTFHELLLFSDKTALNEFRRDKIEFGAKGSAVFAKSSISKDFIWKEGVAIYTLGESGLMIDASLSGQKYWLGSN